MATVKKRMFSYCLHIVLTSFIRFIGMKVMARAISKSL